MQKDVVSQLLVTNPQGLYCVPGDFYLDPIAPVDFACISHAHADHARPGHKNVLATPETLTIMRSRYGDDAGGLQPIQYESVIQINGVKVTFFPAGHILGSAQILLEYKGTRIVFSGDYKRQPDPTCPPFVPLACDLFITEATFGLPVFCHPPIIDEIKKLFNSLALFPDRCHLIGVYVLGKCQRFILALRAANYQKPVYVHGALIKLCELYRTLGFDFGELIPVSHENAPHLKGEIVLCPPGALHDRWSRSLPQPIRGLASGWMRIRARAKQKKIELPLIISDHADWPELLRTINEINPQSLWITHGNEEGLTYFAKSKGYKVRNLSLLEYEDEES